MADDPNTVMREAMRNGLSAENMAKVRDLALNLDPNTLAVYALVDVPGHGVALVGSSDTTEIDIFELLALVVNESPVAQYTAIINPDGTENEIVP